MRTLTGSVTGLSAALLVSVGAGASARGETASFFTSETAFEQYVAQQGKLLKGVETFEESTAAPGSKTPFPNPLQFGVPRPTFDFGISATNLIIQTNITPGPCPPSLNPSSNDRALWVNGAGFIGSNSIKVGTDEFLYQKFSSLDLIFTTHDKTAVGLDVSTFDGFNTGHGGFVLCAYDLAGNVLGSLTIPGPTAVEPAKNFMGVWSPTPIGRVNVWGIFTVPQPFAVDNIQMWTVPAPGSVAVLGLGCLALARRRRGC